MEPHNWSQSHHEPSALYQGYLTAMQFYTCRKCKIVVGLPDNHLRPEPLGCTGKQEVVKQPWQPPYKEKSRDVKKTDYPKKKERKGG